ncbi:MAG TPA: hypothetical protein VM597_37880 [Gemmataceae bacterium]|jgi:hypothetical protein|nr:hypothetical protein [Gemmataceae bacterium]
MSTLSIDAVPRFARIVPDLPPFEPADALPLAAACRLRLVPGHDGRRLSEDELRTWATIGVCVVPGGPRYLFPALWDGDRRVTTLAWCAAWVEFVAAERRGADATALEAS